MNFSVIFFVVLVAASEGFDWANLNLVDNHIPFMFYNQPNLKKSCLSDPTCPYKDYAKEANCWGFEPECKDSFGSSHPTRDCADDRSKDQYYNQADFGYLRKRLDEMNARLLCKPTAKKRSSLRCTREATMCQARNLFVDLRFLNERIVRRDKVALQPGEIGGYCDLDQTALTAETTVKRDLSTWGEQLSPYTELSFDPFDNTDEHCDVVINDPVMFVQLDFGGNMYHHFCDFFNLYLTQLSNNSWFGTDNKIIRWSSAPRYGDLFGSSWKVFTGRDHVPLLEFQGSRVCISQATFAFLPRMAFGLFYSTPLEENCRGSGLFRAFTQHFLHRMGIVEKNLRPPKFEERPAKIRVTMLDRGHTTKYKIFRRVLNQDKLIEAARSIPDIEILLVKYNSSMSFEDQLRITHNSDILIGMHGAGLAHFLFLPDWAVAFELFNCGDIRCYRDLAHLRGLRYMTWENSSKVFEHDKNLHESYGDHAKFWNFTFDPDEFVRLLTKARNWLIENPRFSHLRRHSEL